MKIPLIPNKTMDFGISPIHFKSRLNQQSYHATPVTVGDVKMQRMAIRNKRRRALGLPPIMQYAKL